MDNQLEDQVRASDYSVIEAEFADRDVRERLKGISAYMYSGVVLPTVNEYLLNAGVISERTRNIIKRGPQIDDLQPIPGTDQPDSSTLRSGFYAAFDLHDEGGLVRRVSELLTEYLVALRHAHFGRHDKYKLCPDKEKSIVEFIIGGFIKALERCEVSSGQGQEIIFSLLNKIHSKGVDPDSLAVLRNQIAILIAQNRQTRHSIQTLMSMDPKDLSGRLRARGLVAERVTNPSIAADLLRRHQSVNRSVALVRAIRDGNNAELARLHDLIVGFGGFIEHYTIEQMRARILAPDWVIFRSRGKPVTPQELVGLHPPSDVEEVYGGDIQVQIVPAGMNIQESICNLPERSRGDKYEDGRAIADLIRRYPHIAGVVSDLCAEDPFATQGFASIARVKAFEHIREFHSHVRFLIAEILEVVGIVTQNGERILLSTPIVNAASKHAHLQSKKNPATAGWRLVNREVPVPLEEDDPKLPSSKLIANWYTTVHDLRPS